MPGLIGLDFETYSAISLPDHGLMRYSNDDSFRVLVASLAWFEDSGYSGNRITTSTIDFVHGTNPVKYLKDRIGDSLIVAHNAGFERQVLATLGLDYPAERFIDSAMVGRAAGGASRLEAVAPQLLGSPKIEGWPLVKLFCLPGKYQADSGTDVFDPQIIADNPAEWAELIEYCEMDAHLSLRLVWKYRSYMTPVEEQYAAVTLAMNAAGWNVDIPLVEEMQRRYQDNMAEALSAFRLDCNAPEVVIAPDGSVKPGLNLNSLKQLKEWTAERGVKCVSFNEKHVARYLKAVSKKLDDNKAGKILLTGTQIDNYYEVEQLLKTKQILGGSSLKKLQVVLNTEYEGRLYDQYVHYGAGQSGRTTGRSAQMQNLKRLSADVKDMGELDDAATVWDNGELAANLRQIFTATDPNGRLIVGDFSSVESRGLAYLAGDDHKVDLFREGKDMYKVMAANMYGVAYDHITKEQRQTGKVGELACGYGAGGGAIKSFAEGMGVALTEAEADDIKAKWRLANPDIVGFWEKLNDMLHDVVDGPNPMLMTHRLPDGLVLQLSIVETPGSLLAQHPGAKSVMMSVHAGMGVSSKLILARVFHGCYMRGGNVGYYKPSDRKTGDLWRNHFKDPKTKQVRFYELYGGKLAGILTQSFCRELFMESLLRVHDWCNTREHLTLVGQFHDEIVVDWSPGPVKGTGRFVALDLDGTKAQLDHLMSSPGFAPSFPLAAEIKDDYRYTK